MVKHGHTKKRRAGRYGKVTLKNRTWVRYDPKPNVDKTLIDHWDPSKSVSANLVRIGLCDDPNSNNSSQSQQQRQQQPIEIELFDIPQYDTTPRQQRIPLTKNDEQYIVQCMTKYGTNYTKMFRDIKINYMQHTEDKLEKLGTKFLSLQPNQRTIPIDDIPVSLQTLITKQQNKKKHKN